MKYTMDDVLIGDEVIFDSTELQNNYDHYWTVTHKQNDEVMIELKKFGLDETWTLKVNEIRHISPISDARIKQQQK